jgi:hypothetical protein
VPLSGGEKSGEFIRLDIVALLLRSVLGIIVGEGRAAGGWEDGAFETEVSPKQ